VKDVISLSIMMMLLGTLLWMTWTADDHMGHMHQKIENLEISQFQLERELSAAEEEMEELSEHLASCYQAARGTPL